jgi:hypothetical protein
MLPGFPRAAVYSDNVCARSKTLVILGVAKDLFAATGCLF